MKKIIFTSVLFATAFASQIQSFDSALGVKSPCPRRSCEESYGATASNNPTRNLVAEAKPCTEEVCGSDTKKPAPAPCDDPLCCGGGHKKS